MTLVVSDISIMGITMVGDSAVTQTINGMQTVIADAVKVQYSTTANIGFALWGNAAVDTMRMDYWLSDFIQQSIQPNDPIESVGQKLIDQLNPILSNSGKPWEELVRGIHIAGYKDHLPCLYHIHCGHAHETPHELRLYRDYPEDQGWNQQQFINLLNNAFIQLRNGYHPMFAPLFKSVLEYSNNLKSNFQISFPQNTLESRLDFYKLLVQFVAGTLSVSGIHPGVNHILSSIAFNETGLKVDEQLDLQQRQSNTSSNLAVYF